MVLSLQWGKGVNSHTPDEIGVVAYLHITQHEGFLGPHARYWVFLIRFDLNQSYFRKHDSFLYQKPHVAFRPWSLRGGVMESQSLFDDNVTHVLLEEHFAIRVPNSAGVP